MKNSPTAFICAGFNFNTTSADEEYDYLANGLQKLGYEIVRVDINWKRKDHDRYVGELAKVFTANSGETNILIGNSFGALAALLFAAKRPINRLVLCSLSPFFKETLSSESGMKYAEHKFGRFRADNLAQYSIKDISSAVNSSGSQVDFIYGELEKQSVPFLVDFTKEVAPLFNDSKIYEASSAPHSLSNVCYQEAVLNLLKGTKVGPKEVRSYQ